MSQDSSPNPSGRAPEKRSFQIPHIYAILFIFILLAGLATWLIPAGAYDTVPGPDGRTTIDADSFHWVPASPAGPTELLLAIPRGLLGAGEVVFFTLLIGGMFAVLRRTGIIELGVDHLTRHFAGRSLWVIPVLMVLFAVLATIIGTQELSLVYVPVILPLLIALRFDSVTAAAIALCATTAGFAAGVINPINTGLAQQLANLPLYSGFGLRLLALVLMLTVAVFWVIRYARRVRDNPEASLMHDDADEQQKRTRYQHALNEVAAPATGRQKLCIAVTLGLFGMLVYGVLGRGWFMSEMAGLFIVMGIVAGLVAGLKIDEICEGFNEGFRDVLMGAMIAGIARAVAVVLEDGQVLDTMVYSLGHLVGGLPTALSALGMYLAQLGFNFVVPSGSGQALVTMPIMAPLSDVIGVTRQTAVLAYQLGDGIGNILYPTSGYFMATLALAGVPWQKWVRFFLPLFGMWVGIAVVLLIVAQATGWQG
ncbi:YfcC family protein [Kushneria indalinina]|uniref:Putative ion transporter superfamily protein YfcC n=1 Tax=Kushneria indalinina DSM 14324 TaxID=1122140 RepID=A0A3D9DSZ2_9GAMM|nr:TIGR00366 family protein [Kushneria indalinina]REC93846.1 putative ion transporter superfamily protein YfcC [Kushneria indalinina DSM 14324]